MSSVARYVIVVAVSVMGVAAAWTSVLANRVLVLNGPAPETQQAAPRGQTTTRLPDGGWLIIGGEVDGEPVATATIVDPNGAARMLRLGQPRAWHSATVLPDGTVLIAGGSGRGGQVVGAADLFDPATGAFVPFPVGGSAARTGHTATLLTDGRVFVFGGGAHHRAALHDLDAPSRYGPCRGDRLADDARDRHHHPANSGSRAAPVGRDDDPR